jgi:hypothetical protein
MIVPFMAVVVPFVVVVVVVVCVGMAFLFKRGIGRFRVGVVFEDIGSAQRFAFRAQTSRQLVCLSG